MAKRKEIQGPPPPCPLHPRCFPNPNVLIDTNRGKKPINYIEVGDMVLTYKKRFKPVTELIFTPMYSANLVHITTYENSYPLVVTPSHPILVNNNWLPARDIKVNDLLGSMEVYKMKVREKSLEVKSIDTLQLAPVKMLYNFSVADDESYIADGFIVHNCRCSLLPVTNTYKELGLDIEEIEDAARPFTRRQMKNIDAGGKRKIIDSGYHKGDYESWFNGHQSGGWWQKNVVGPGRAKLLRTGKVNYKDFVDPMDGRVLTIKELKKKFLR